MFRRPRLGPALSLLLLSGAFGCGGSVAGVPGNDASADQVDGHFGKVDGGSDTGQPAETGAPDTRTEDSPIPKDALPPDTGSPSPYDGTTGKPCTTSADCHSAHGPNVAICSNTAFGAQDYYPTAVCILPTCSPVSDSTVHYCDGPDDPSSPGVCVPQGGSASGICLPKCTYDDKGSAPVGCVGKDLCFSYTASTTGGVGYCWAGCKVDGDCQNGQKCQADEGLCVKGVVPTTKGFGAACTQKDTNAGVCNCFYGKSGTGYCSSVCAVGDPKGCPKSATCDAIEFRSLGYSTSNVGMGGYCAVTCSADGGTCPGATTCTDVLAAGPDCIPP